MEDDAASTTLVSRIIPLLWRLGTVTVAVVAVVGGILYAKQDSLLYFPEIGGIPRRPQKNPKGYRSPNDFSLPYENLTIPCSDGVHIHAWLLTISETAPTMLFFHGNAGNIGLRLPNAVEMMQYLRCNVLMVEYRGYGNSDSVAPTEAGLRLDAEAALEFCQSHPSIDPNQLFVFGRSLGGAVAVHLAEYAVRRNVALAGVVLENTFTSISDMVDQLMPFLTPIKAFVLRIGWNSLETITTLKRVPILFLAGGRDELVPHWHMQRLYQLALANNPAARLHVIPDGTHNESWRQGGPNYWDAMRQFMAQCLQRDMSQPHLPANIVVGAEASIPIMSDSLFGMAKDAARTESAGAIAPKKEL